MKYPITICKTFQLKIQFLSSCTDPCITNAHPFIHDRLFSCRNGFGVSRQLAQHYVQKGWLKQLGSGYYLRAGDKFTEAGAMASLEPNGVKVHIGGKSALAFKGLGVLGIPPWQACSAAANNPE